MPCQYIEKGCKNQIFCIHLPKTMTIKNDLLLVDNVDNFA